MEEQSQEVVRESVSDQGNTATRTRTVSSTATTGVMGERIVQYLLGLVEALLGLRLVLSLLGANRGNAFAELIYNVTAPLVSPFSGLLGYEFEAGVARLEIETLIAMAVYALIGLGISKLFTLKRT
jgi:YggT family protein